MGVEEIGVYAAFLCVGIVTGIAIGYIIWHQPLWKENRELVRHIIDMKKRGFVPQYEFEQRVTPDPSEDIVEY